MANLSNRPDSPGSSSEGKTDTSPPLSHTHTQPLISSGHKHMADDLPFPIVTSSLPFCDQKSLVSALFNFLQNPAGARRQRKPSSRWTSSWGANLASDRRWGTLSVPQGSLLNSRALSMVGWKNCEISHQHIMKSLSLRRQSRKSFCWGSNDAQSEWCWTNMKLGGSSGNSNKEPRKMLSIDFA